MISYTRTSKSVKREKIISGVALVLHQLFHRISYKTLIVCGYVLMNLKPISYVFDFSLYRHSSIYAVNAGTHIKNHGSKNRVNRGYLVVLKGRKIG